MRRSIILTVLAFCLSGCATEEKNQGIGVIPLSGATVTGRVVEASGPTGVLLKTESERSFLLPEDWEYRRDGQAVAVDELVPGSTVTAVAPAIESRLVSAADNTLLLGSGDSFFSFPVEGLAAQAREVPVAVRTTGGQSWQMPLGQAVASYPSQMVSHPYYHDYAFPEADPTSVYKGVPVGAYGGSPLLLTPTEMGARLVRLPQAYPQQQLVSHQPTRFTYVDNNVAVSTWDSLGDGQFDLSKLLLAGTLLDVLPGQAIIEVGQAPVAVPWSHVTYQGAPVGQRRFPVGTPLGISYAPGVYDLVSYDLGNVTLLHHQQVVQLPAHYLPNRGYNHRVKVRKPKGQWVSMPFHAADPLLATGDYWVCPSPVAQPYIESWHQQPAWTPRPVRGKPGYRVVGHSGRGPARVVKAGHPRHQRHDSWWSSPQEWAYDVTDWAAPAELWNRPAAYHPPLVKSDWERGRRDGRRDSGRQAPVYGQRDKGQRPVMAQHQRRGSEVRPERRRQQAQPQRQQQVRVEHSRRSQAQALPKRQQQRPQTQPQRRQQAVVQHQRRGSEVRPERRRQQAQPQRQQQARVEHSRRSQAQASPKRQQQRPQAQPQRRQQADVQHQRRGSEVRPERRRQQAQPQRQQQARVEHSRRPRAQASHQQRAQAQRVSEHSGTRQERSRR